MIDDTHQARRGRGAVRALAGGGLLLLSLALSACNGTSERLREMRADPGACRPGTFIGTMAGNCPQPVR